MTPLQTRLCEDMLDLEQLKADLGSAEGRYGQAARRDVRLQLEALEAHYAALLRQAAGTGRPFES